MDLSKAKVAALDFVKRLAIRVLEALVFSVAALSVISILILIGDGVPVQPDATKHLLMVLLAGLVSLMFVVQGAATRIADAIRASGLTVVHVDGADRMRLSSGKNVIVVTDEQLKNLTPTKGD